MYVPNAYAEGPGSIGAAQDVVLNPITDKKIPSSRNSTVYPKRLSSFGESI